MNFDGNVNVAEPTGVVQAPLPSAAPEPAA